MIRLLKILSKVALLLFPVWAFSVEVGDKAPDFQLPNQNGTTSTLNEHAGKWVILYFYPMDDTPGCTTEACNFRDATDRILAKRAVVYGVSVDDIESHKHFATKYKLPFSLLADVDGAVSKKYDSFSAFLGWKVAHRNTFIISPDGNIAKKYIGVDPNTHVQQVLKDLTKLQSN